MSICQYDPLLVENNVRIDDFANPGSIYFLTHAHQDHMSGLNSNFTESIWCSETTRDLVTMQKPQISKDRFNVLKMDTKYHLLENVTVIAIDSNHCDGSIMLIFEILHDHNLTRLLYTSDFRFHSEMRHNAHLRDMDKMYFDDTLYKMDVLGYPDYKTTFENMVMCILDIRQRRGFEVPIYINCHILGIEKILIRVASYLKEGFSVSTGVSGTYRESQIRYLLNEHMDDASSLILANKSRDDLAETEWIIPTSLHFICLKQDAAFKDVPANHHYIWFCTHANKYEITRLQTLTGAKDLIGCSFAIDSLKCIKKHK